MRVVHVALGRANPARMNGVNTVVHSLATEQRALGVEVDVWGLTSSRVSDQLVRSYRLRLFAPPRLARPLARDLRGAIRELQSDTVVHFHGGLIPAFSPVAATLRHQGVRYVITPHGAYNARALEKRRVMKSLYVALVERTLVKGASAVHCVGVSEYENARRVFPSARSFVVPNGFAIEAGSSSPTPPAGRPPVFGYCGRLDIWTKGLDVLFEGFERYRHAGGTGVLWIIGDGPDALSLRERTVAAGVAGSVVFWGERYDGEKVRLIQGMDAFVYPSRFEGFPMSVLEAASLGRCLVVSDRTNTEEYVERFGAGYVVRQESQEQLATVFAALEAGVATGVVATMGGHARRMVAEELNWPRIAARLLHEYETCLTDRVSSGEVTRG